MYQQCNVNNWYSRWSLLQWVVLCYWKIAQKYFPLKKKKEVKGSALTSHGQLWVPLCPQSPSMKNVILLIQICCF